MTSPSPADSASALEENTRHPFADRPTFEQVVQQMLEQALKEKYPELTIDLSRTRLATPDASGQGYHLKPFMPLVLDYLALGTPVDFSSRGTLDCYLSDSPPSRLWSGNERLDMAVIEKRVRELPWSVPIGLEDALTRFWNGDVDTPSLSETSLRISRWQWLSNALRDALHVRGLRQPGLSVPARDALDQLARWPDRAQRTQANASPVYAYGLKDIVTRGSTSTELPGSHILLLYYTELGLTVLLCSPSGTVQSFESIDAVIRYRGEQIAKRYLVDTVTCQRYELAGDVFEAQAAMILEQQLADLSAVQLPARIALADLKALYSELSDPSRYLRDAPRLAPDLSKQLVPLLPDWLKQASLADRARFRRYSLALASAKSRAQGRLRVNDINAFTAQALLEEMKRTNDSSPDKVEASHFQPDDIELIFTVYAGYPGTVGISENRTLSLTQLAIANLVARPSGHFKLSHRHKLKLPAWLTPEFITRRNGLIEQVNIGETYPRYLQQELLDDTTHAQHLQQIFAEHVSAQMPLEALQHLLSHKNGISRQGLLLIEALLQPDAERRQVDGRPVVIRHLALLRKPQAHADIVANMFIIEAQDAKTGPHLLYRPLYAPSLLEFATREALLQAIATAGDVQTSVLTWMSDTARPIYANGGFKEPHIVRFLQGDEFGAPERPAPATLAIDGANDELLQYLNGGKLLHYLYGCNAQALVNQADRNAVSNRESRWAILFEGVKLVFNSLVFPFLRGPALAMAWISTLADSLVHDIPALSSEDAMTRELAIIDLLINLALLPGQFSSSAAPSHPPIAESLKEQAIRPPAPRVIPEQWPAPAKPGVREGTVTLPDAHSNVVGQNLDLSFTSARNRLTPEQRTQLRGMQVSRPESLPTPIRYGPFTGLFVIDGKWHALLDGDLFRISPQEDGSARIIDPLDPSKSGPVLQSDGQGHWSIDLGLRLKGGMPPKRLAQLQKQNSARRDALNKEWEDFYENQEAQDKAYRDIEGKVREGMSGAGTPKQRLLDRQKFYQLLETHTEVCLNLLKSQPERQKLHVELPRSMVVVLTKNVLNNAEKAYVLVALENADFLDAHPEFKAGQKQEAPVDRLVFRANVEQSYQINKRGIYWLNLRDEHQEQLLNLDPSSARDYTPLSETSELKAGNIFNLLAQQATTLAMLSIRQPFSDATLSLGRLLTPLTEQIRSHSDLNRYALSPSDNLTILESLTEQYGKALDSLGAMKALYAEDLDIDYFGKLFELVENLYKNVSGKLATELKPEEVPRKRLPKPPITTAKKVIKTRDGKTLIGDLKPAGTSDLPIEVVELRSEVDGELLETYSRHEDDAWSPVDVRRTPPEPKTRSIDKIKGDAQKLLKQLDERLRRAERYKENCRYPQEIEEILSNEANNYRTLSEELDRAFTARQAPRNAADQALSQKLANAISRLTAKGSDLRTELSLALPPTDGNIRYLFEKNLIQVARLGERKPLKGARKDFLQEYAVNDRNGFPLWYAHFHYEAMDTPKADYNVAHLKTKAQRREHYHSLLAKANNPYAVIDVHRGQIGRSLAQSRFLPLAP